VVQGEKMTPEAIEQLTARKLADSALRTAGYHSAPADRETVAITFLLAAVELLTPELSQAGRARLFLRDE